MTDKDKKRKDTIGSQFQTSGVRNTSTNKNYVSKSEIDVDAEYTHSDPYGSLANKSDKDKS